MLVEGRTNGGAGPFLGVAVAAGQAHVVDTGAADGEAGGCPSRGDLVERDASILAETLHGHRGGVVLPWSATVVWFRARLVVPLLESEDGSIVIERGHHQDGGAPGGHPGAVAVAG